MKVISVLTFFLLMGLQADAQQWMRRTNLPAVYVNTYNNAAVTSKNYYIYSTFRYVDEEDVVTEYDSTQIRGRGNSTWNLRKKPYKLKFNQKEKLLGKGYAKAKKWTLLANAGDKTMIRNAVTSAMGEFTSLKFNPAYKFVDMVLNNQYMGTYQISDQVEVRPHRVNITEQDYPLNETSDITGGYLLEVDGFKDGNCFTTSHYGVPVRIHYPEDEEIDARQNTYIRDYIREFETVLSSNNFDDPVNGYRSMVDSASLIDWYLCNEISANIDGFYSTYFYKDQQDPRLYWGPLWDFDIAYSNDYRMWNEHGLSTTAYSLMVNIGYGQTKQWVNRMWQDTWFAAQVNRRYNELLDAGLVSYLNNTIDSLVTLLYESQQLNYQKWGINTRMYHETVLYSSYDQYISDLRQFISDHTAWLKEEFATRKPAEPTPEFVAQDYYYRITNASTAKAIELSEDNMAVQHSNEKEREVADWYIRKTPSGHYQIINRSAEMALNDPTPGTATAMTNVGTPLNAVEPDETNSRQLWDILPQGTEGFYNLLNVYTQHIANLSGGSSADGTAILSYTNDNRNGVSKNRLWYFIPTSVPVPESTGIGTMEPDNYALAYNNVSKTLHFGAENRADLQFHVMVYNASGRLVGRFRADESFSMWSQPSGVYVVTWTMGGKQRSVKFMK